MIASLRAEFRKLLTVRSTYVILGIALLAMLFFAFYINGFRAEPKLLLNPKHLAQESTQAMNALAFFFSLVGLLLLAHEYRYNTIMYTLTASNSRSRTLFAKVIAVSCFALLASLLTAILAPALAWLGVQLAGHQLAPQIIPLGDTLWRCLFFGWGYAMIALLLITLMRNQIGAIVTLFMVPITAEPLLSLLLKTKTVYLPFMSLSQVLAIPGVDAAPQGSGSLTPLHGAMVFSLYLVVGWIVAWVLFLRRDAN